MIPFARLIGQQPAIELLTQAIVQQRVAPAYLFAGPAGVGRGLAAECFLQLLLTNASTNPSLLNRIQQRNHPDLLWVEPTYLHQGKRLTVAEATAAGLKRKSRPIIRLEQVREVTRFLARSPLEAPRSVVVLEQAETMAEGAANGLLKTLEEPGQATLILIAPGVESLLPTLVSRCQRIPFSRLSTEALTQVLQQAEQTELLQHPQILQLAQGSPGEAIAHWQQLQTIPPDLLRSLTQLPRSSREALSLAREIDKSVEADAQLWLLDYLQQSYWSQSGATALSYHQALGLAIQLLEQAKQFLLQNVQPRLVWEVTLLRLASQYPGGI